MKIILGDDNFSSILEVKRGTHSIRNMETARARGCGCSKDKHIRELSGNKDGSKVCMLIRLSHDQMKNLLLIFVKGDQFITKSERTLEFQRIGY